MNRSQHAGPTIPHKEPVRRFPTLFPLDSSDATPSDHSSIYDAVIYTSGSDTDEAQHESARNRGYVSPNLTDRRVGTRLSTITEQKSTPTLKQSHPRRGIQRGIAFVAARNASPG